MKSYILQETNWHTVKDTKYQVAVLPWGATRPIITIYLMVQIRTWQLR